MRVCVTGAAGFIGQHVCKVLKAERHEVVGLDLVKPENVTEWVCADIEKVLPAGKYDAVIHLAAMANPRACEGNPGKALSVNVGGTWNALNMATASGARKFVFASSAHVYGISPKYLPTDEEHPLWLQNTYTMSKILGEAQCSLYHANHGLPYTVLRLYNAYGPGQSVGYFVPDIIRKAGTGMIKLSGSNTTKDWVYVTDVAKAFEKALHTSFVGAVNIGTGIETDLTAIAGIISERYGAALEAIPTANATRMRADRSRAYRVLNWEPTWKLEDGIAACLGQAEERPVPA